MDYSLGQLKWRSRRSTLELDIYFDKFIQNGYLNTLNQDELDMYNNLLNMDDSDILLMIQGLLPVNDNIMQDLINKIRFLK
jgi:succinate dehydrogenase flavin-adding protein (antitoxin of CptAB toxin-antitoxin module)